MVVGVDVNLNALFSALGALCAQCSALSAQCSAFSDLGSVAAGVIVRVHISLERHGSLPARHATMWYGLAGCANSLCLCTQTPTDPKEFACVFESTWLRSH